MKKENLLEHWIFRKVTRLPARVFDIDRRDLEGLTCRGCKADMKGLDLEDLGGGSFVQCKSCRAKHFLKKELS